MITREQIPAVLDHDVHDVNGDKIGAVKHVFLDEATGQPEWLCVKTGLFGARESFVPMQDAELVTDHVAVPYDKDRVKDAPNIDVDAGGHLSGEEERDLYRYYGMNWESSWQQANQPGESGWAHEAGQRERERLTDTDTGVTGAETGYADTGVTGAEAGYADTGTAAEAGDIDTGRRDDAMTRSEEQLNVGTEIHERGRARLRKYVDTEEQQVNVSVTREEARVEHEPITEANIDQAMSGPDITEAEHEVTLYEERPTVAKETVPVERVRMTKDQITEEETISEEVRKERIDVEGDTDETGRS